MAGFGPIGSFPVASLPTGGKFFPVAGGIVFKGSNVLPYQHQVLAGVLAFHGGAPTAILTPPRVTWFGAEALHVGCASSRVSWSGLEVLRTVLTKPPATQVTWMGVELAHVGAARSRVTWMGVEVLRTIRRADSGWVSLIAA